MIESLLYEGDPSLVELRRRPMSQNAKSNEKETQRTCGEEKGLPIASTTACATCHSKIAFRIFFGKVTED